ncbi:biotin holocarboxylase synthetase [Lobosporangium transversale]|uniref:Biotin-protein ligase n=1 Tax=Lobosporangium transversale TaxID=64571 RepID=A0A1Y2GP33_9FUNG|nr:biotin-protein ligase [Lobosporangium transversale]KAF9911935.1 biotin holocarboxylase synthetase [Lobosporangium transversale]ORZ17448.1 biotin-protein ligase [Lobosporangium transversale]|eukprot:XP_021881835.1 biotin-protein ligase [Lobosporangium transversale]
MNVLVYSGEGTSRISLAHTVRSLRSLVGQHYDVMKIDAKGLLTEPWEESTALLVIPGGRDIPYTKDLNGAINQKIQAYVQGGGRFCGICAGAYFASDHIVFQVGTPIEVQGERELKFFAGECRGVVVPGFVYDSEQGAKAVEIQLDRELLATHKLGFSSTRVYFNGGGCFLDAEKYPGTQVLARYSGRNGEESHGVNAPAIIICQVGNGLALLTGVHLEYDPAHLDSGNPEYGPLPNVVTCLLESERERTSLLRSLLTKLGLKLTHPDAADTSSSMAEQVDTSANGVLPPGAIQGIPDLSSLYLASINSNYTADLTKILKGLATPEGLIKEPNDTFQLIASPQHTVPVHTPTLSEATEGESEEKIIKNLVLCPEQPPAPSLTPYFNMDNYFKHLHSVRGQNKMSSFNNFKFGNSLLYGQVVTSTQTMLDKNFALCQRLPDGFVCNATTQIAGRGRGRNSWISPPGCLQFSMVLRHPVQARHASAVFVQYLVALAVVESVCSLPGYEGVPLKLKWPNDIYAEAPLEENEQEQQQQQQGVLPKMVKIGGVLVNSNFSGSEFLLVIGCGVNTTNPNPTTSINHLIRYHNRVTGKNLALFTQESLLANILVKLEEMYNLFLHGNGTGFAQLEELYYKRWLHSNAFVTLTTMTPHQRVRIQGISLDYGLLRTIAVDDQGRDIPNEEHRLQPDGNSFDMLKGLISTKA